MCLTGRYYHLLIQNLNNEMRKRVVFPAVFCFLFLRDFEFDSQAGRLRTASRCLFPYQSLKKLRNALRRNRDDCKTET